jgi:hypothetical protein
MRLALPVSDDVFAPVEEKIPPTEFYCLAFAAHALLLDM